MALAGSSTTPRISPSFSEKLSPQGLIPIGPLTVFLSLWLNVASTGFQGHQLVCSSPMPCRASELPPAHDSVVLVPTLGIRLKLASGENVGQRASVALVNSSPGHLLSLGWGGALPP